MITASLPCCHNFDFVESWFKSSCLDKVLIPFDLIMFVYVYAYSVASPRTRWITHLGVGEGDDSMIHKFLSTF